MEELKEHPQILSILENISKKEGFENFQITNIVPNSKGEGYLSQIFAVTIKDDTSDRKLELIVKAAFTNINVREEIPIRKAFLNEINIYSKYAPRIKQMASMNNIKEAEFFPKCYEASSHDGYEVLVFENLKKVNFNVIDKRFYLDEEHCNLIFQRYGRFHAYGFAMKEKKPEEYEELGKASYNVMSEFTARKDCSFNKYLEASFEQIIEFFEPGKEDRVREKLQKYRSYGSIEILQNTTKKNGKFSTILHGDCWSNNILFKYDNSTKLQDMRFIDLQLSIQGSPACDLSYCLYSGAPSKVYENLESYLQIYHNSLSNALRDLGSDVETLYPFRVCKEEWKTFAKFGFIMAMLVTKAKLIQQENVKDYTDMFENDEKKDTYDVEMSTEDINEYKNRMRHLIIHLDKIDAL